MTDVHVIHWIELAKLHAHPANANVMAAGALRKLSRHIEKTGRYEPLLVRPHPEIGGEYQLINGHHRKRILEGLGHGQAACLVWELDDAQSLLMLATVNRLAGRDVPGKRLALVRELDQTAGVGDLAMLLPEDDRTLRKLLYRGPPPLPAAASLPAEMPEAFTVFLPGEEKRRLVAELKRTNGDVAAALLSWCRERGNAMGR